MLTDIPVKRLGVAWNCQCNSLPSSARKVFMHATMAHSAPPCASAMRLFFRTVDESQCASNTCICSGAYHPLTKYFDRRENRSKIFLGLRKSRFSRVIPVALPLSKRLIGHEIHPELRNQCCDNFVFQRVRS